MKRPGRRADAAWVKLKGLHIGLMLGMREGEIAFVLCLGRESRRAVHACWCSSVVSIITAHIR